MAWKVDPEQSRIEFSIKHLTVTTVHGSFSSFEGTIEINEENPKASSAQGTVDAASVRSGVSLRNATLRAAGRFDAKRFPTMRFESTQVGDFEGDSFKVYGKLTIKGITRPVVFDVVNKGEQPTGNGRRRWVFGASIVLNRRDWKIQWHPLIEVGNLLIGAEVRGEIEIVAVEEKTKVESLVSDRQYAAIG